jgi:peptidoglycan hydrolase CwlO-like protein
LQHTQDELVAAQGYAHYIKTELHEKDKQVEASQAQVADLQHQVEHLQELIPPEPEEPEKDPEEIEGMSGVDDD